MKIKEKIIFILIEQLKWLGGKQIGLLVDNIRNDWRRLLQAVVIRSTVGIDFLECADVTLPHSTHARGVSCSHGVKLKCRFGYVKASVGFDDEDSFWSTEPLDGWRGFVQLLKTIKDNLKVV